MPGIVISDLLRQFFDEKWPFGARADEAHVPTQHIYDLRQLVDTYLADESADSRGASILRGRPLRTAVALRIIAHAAELEDLKRTPTSTDALLAIQDGCAVLEQSCQCRDCHDGRGNNEQSQTCRNVNKTFYRLAH